MTRAVSARAAAVCLVLMIGCITLASGYRNGIPAQGQSISATQTAATAVLPSTADTAETTAEVQDAAAFAAVAAGKKRRLLVVFNTDIIMADAGPSFAAEMSATSDDMSSAAAASMAVQRTQLVSAAKRDTLSKPEVAAASTITKEFEHLPVSLVTVRSSAALAALKADRRVKSVHAPRRFKAQLSSTLPFIQQPQAAAAGATGSGCMVAVIDTGCNYTRPAFGTCTRDASGALIPSPDCKVAATKDIVADDGLLDDPAQENHGTNVAATILGVAPAAKIVALDVFDGFYTGEAEIIDAYNWILSPSTAAAYPICSINLSLGGGQYNSTCSGALADTILAARQKGILTAVASGNNDWSDSMAYPACAPAAVSVGAAYDVNYGYIDWGDCIDDTTFAGKPACWSNSASFLTMLAPGVDVSAADITMSGTSQAAPHIAGALAALKSVAPTAGPDQIVSWLTSFGVPVLDARNGVTTPRVDLNASVAAAKAGLGILPPKDTTAPTGSIVINGGATYTKSLTLSLALTATDASGVGTMCVGTSSTPQCSPWDVYATSKTYTLSSTQGARAVNVWFADTLGNAMTVPATSSIILDINAPTMGTASTSLTSTSITVTWSAATDAVSGVASYRLVYLKGTSVPAVRCASGTSVPITQTGKATITGLSKNTAYTLRLCATDKAGNVASGWTASVKTAAALAVSSVPVESMPVSQDSLGVTASQDSSAVAADVEASTASTSDAAAIVDTTSDAAITAPSTDGAAIATASGMESHASALATGSMTVEDDSLPRRMILRAFRV